MKKFLLLFLLLGAGFAVYRVMKNRRAGYTDELEPTGTGTAL